jgi:adenylate cyclase
MQKILLDQIGYTEEDKIEDVGREDNSYLFRFTFGPRAPQTVHDDEEFSTFRRVDLQARNLLTVPIFLYKYASRIASLDLSKNLMMEIPVDFVQMCKGLKQLWITNNDYFVVPSSIKYIPALEHLNISNNQIASLEQACLEDIITLKTMRAYNNRLESLPDSFQQFMNLTILFISNNFFSKFPMVVCQIKSLAYLDISFNKVSSFPDELGNLTNLVGLFAISNRLSGSLPDSFAKLEKLQELDLRQNQITDLDILSQLPQLEVVSIDYNAVSVINYGFRNLRKFRMSKNHITQFNLVAPAIPALNDMTKCMLTDLNISNCKLTSLPDGLFNHTPNLENLILDHNTLSELPTSIGVLLKLIKLSAQGNNLEKLPGEIYNLGELKILDVQRNNMKSLPKEIWLCVSLQTLNCSSNLLEVFPEPLRPQKSGSFQSQSKSQRSSFDNDSYPSSRKPSFSTFHGSSITSIIPNSDIDMSPVTEEPNSDLINPQLLSSGFHPPPNFNPPSFFASPRNHPPPLSLSLRNLFLGDNSLTDDVWSPLSLFLELRTLNLSFNDLYEIPPDGLCHQHLYELYLSGNQLASLPADDIEKLSYLRVLAVNGNKLQTLPAEIGKLRKLLVLDVGNNVLKYNISNWPYDWNW